ncbi:hypothetical protein [Streptomyces goshikiensis]|uniref:hypothetical protein n=1 Tax=Streptomyces goshikiensis TaxID=1942 RepID=UPI0037F4291E
MREKAPPNAAEWVEELTEALGEAAHSEPNPRRQREAVPLAIAKDTIAAMKVQREKITGMTLAERLGHSDRSGYRYFGEAQVAQLANGGGGFR